MGALDDTTLRLLAAGHPLHKVHDRDPVIKDLAAEVLAQRARAETAEAAALTLAALQGVDTTGGAA